MRALLIVTALLAGCGDAGEEAGFAPSAVGNASADEARAIGEAEEMLENEQAVPGSVDGAPQPAPDTDPGGAAGTDESKRAGNRSPALLFG